MEENKRVEYPFNNPDCPEFDTCFELKIAMSQKEKDDQKGEITKDVIFQTAGGSPLGVYPTLADIQKAYDTGAIDSTKGVYLSMDDGFWNYYDHKLNKWVKGKLYQATAVSPEDPTITDLENKIQGNRTYIETVESDLNKHIENANAKFEIVDKRLDNHNDRLNDLEDIVHETIVTEVEDDFVGNRINVPTSVEIEGRNFGVIDNQYFKVSAIKGQTKKSKNLITFPYTDTDKEVAGVNYKVLNDRGIRIYGTPTGYGKFSIASKIAVKPNTTYYFNIGSNRSFNALNLELEFNEYNEKEGYIGNATYDNNVSNVSFTTSENTKFLDIGIKRLVDGKSINVIAYPILSYEQAKYEPYFEDLQNTTIKDITSVGVNRWSKATTIENTRNETIKLDKPLPKGQYTFSVESVESSDTDRNYSTINIFDEKLDYLGEINFSRGKGKQSKTLIFDRAIGGATFYASMDYSTSAGDTFKYTNFQVEKGGNATTFKPYETDTTITLKPNMLTLNGVNELYDEAILTKTLDAMGEPTELFEVDIVRKFAMVDLGTLTWGKESSVAGMFFTKLADAKAPYKGICGKYEESPYYSSDNAWNQRPYVGAEYNLLIVDTTLANLSALEFKEKMSGVKFVYELATSTRSKVKDNLSLGDVSVLGQKGGEIQINPIESNIVEPKETSFNFDIRYWEQPTNKGGNL